MSEHPGAAPPHDDGWGVPDAGAAPPVDEPGAGVGLGRSGVRPAGRASSAPGEAARAYQAVIADLTAAAGDLRERDLARAAELAGGLVGRDEAMMEARQRTRLTDMVVTLHWEAALESLWDEQWMTLRLRPAPVPADAARLPELEAAVEQRSAELQDAVRHRWYRPR